jgi:hypothetical protein
VSVVALGRPDIGAPELALDIHQRVARGQPRGGGRVAKRVFAALDDIVIVDRVIELLGRFLVGLTLGAMATRTVAPVHFVSPSRKPVAHGSFLLAERVGDVRKIVRSCQWQLYGV